MESYRTEEEQVEALKKWWEENGKSTLVTILLVVAAGLGWRGWQDHQQQVAEQASARYDQMIEAFQQTNSAEDAMTLRTLAEDIKSDFAGSTYAQFAALHLARIDVVAGDLDSAEQELRWVLTQGPAPELEQLAQLRLARVMAAKGDPAGALVIVTATEAGAYAPAYAEAEGDFQQQLGDTDAAIAAYEKALRLSADTRTGISDSLQLKINALSPVPARELAATEE